MNAKSMLPKLGLERFSGLYLWALFIVVFSVWVPSLFFTTDNLHLLASANVVAAVIALGATLPLAAGVFDLSVGATANLCAVLVVVLQTDHGIGMWPSIAITLVAGVVVGLVNGLVVVKLHVSSLIATLGTSTILLAVQEMIQGAGGPQPPTSSAWSNITQHVLGGFQILVVYLVVLALICWWVLAHTPAGRYIYAVGGNEDAARLSGVKVGKWQILTLMASGLLCAFGGILYSSQSGPSLTFGPALLLPTFAAVFLGSTQFTPGRVNVWGTVVAVYVLATGVNGLQFVTGVAWLNNMFSGVALIAAVSFAVWRQRAGTSGFESAASTPAEIGPGDADDASHSAAPTTTGSAVRA